MKISYIRRNRFKFVLENDLFVASTYLNFRFKKFEFIKDKLELSLFLSQLIDSDPVDILSPRIDLALEIEFNVYDNIIVSLDKNLKSVQADSPLKFFFNYEKKFPKLAKLAREILCVPATSVPSESLFSVTGIIHNEQRNRINPSLLNQLNFIKYNSK